jgi:hypothetical protein
MIEVLGVKNADKLVPIEDDQTPRDPISENMAFLNGEPTKAFIYQDHDAHIATHSTFMQDPMIAQQMGQNPMAQQMMGAIQAHIAEHLAFLYRKKIEEQLGVPLPKPNEQMPEEMEVQLSQLVAQASTQLLQQNMAMAQQQKNQQMQQDPIIQMQQAELQIKQQEAQTRAAKVQGEGAPESLVAAIERVSRWQDADVLIIGEAARAGYGAVAPAGRTWADVILDEIRGAVDLSRVHFTGRVRNYPPLRQAAF